MKRLTKWLKMKVLTYNLQIQPLYITQDEIKSCIKNLKNNKCCLYDGIKNEHACIESTQLITLPIFEKLFNLIFHW
jgi:hypothetical protein